MKGLFECYALGKTKEKSKSGKFHYLFVVGELDKSTGLFTSFQPVDFWSEDDFALDAGKVYKLVLDINGEIVKFVKFA